MSKLARELLTKSIAEEAATRGVDRQLVPDRIEVDFSRVLPLTEVLLGLFDEALSVGTHLRFAQGRVKEAELLLHHRWGRVVSDALAEDRRHQLVGLGLTDVLVAETKVSLLCLRPGHHHRVAAGKLHREDVPEQISPALNETNRILPHLQGVAQYGQATSKHGRPTASRMSRVTRTRSVAGGAVDDGHCLNPAKIRRDCNRSAPLTPCASSHAPELRQKGHFQFQRHSRRSATFFT